GLRLQPLLERTRRLRRLPAPQDGSRGGGAPHPHRPRHGLRAARAVTLRARLSLVAAGVVAVVLALVCATVYFVMRHELYSQVDSQPAAHARDPTEHLPGLSPYGSDYVSFVAPDGSFRGDKVPVDSRITAVAASGTHGFYRNASAVLPSGQPIVIRE